MRRLKLDESFINKCLELMKAQLQTNGLECTGKSVKFSLSREQLATEFPTPILELTARASLKMWALIFMQATKEIAWHGTAVRTEQGFLIEDILVFPQNTTAATASGDDDEYNNWLLNLDDSTFDKLRFHGHSHVKMNTSPSATDLTYQEHLTRDIKDFYIVGIFNQNYSAWLRIIDMAQGVIYDTEDITLRCSVIDANVWAKQAIKDNEIVKKAVTPAYTTPTTAYSGYYARQGSVYDSIKRETSPELYGNKKEKGASYWDYYEDRYHGYY